MRGRLRWGYIGALLNAAPGGHIEPSANADVNDFPDSESGDIVHGVNGGEPDGNTIR